MKKYSIIVALFLLLAVFGAVFFFGKGKKDVAVNVPEPVATNTQTSTTTAPKKEVISTPGVILIGDRAKYENLSEEEKQIIDRFFKKYSDVYKMQLDGFGNEIAAKNTFPLKYYDDKTVVVAVPDGKAGSYLNVYDMSSLKQLNDNLKAYVYLFGNITETNSYIISASDAQYSYYKKGERETNVVIGSLLTSKNETYVKLPYFDVQYDFTFDAETRTLSVSVFTPINSSNKPNPKLRTETFVLP